jgi:hypothetical protein
LPPGQYPACTSIQLPECVVVQKIAGEAAEACADGAGAVQGALETACDLIPGGELICQLIVNVGVSALCAAFVAGNIDNIKNYVDEVMGCECDF